MIKVKHLKRKNPKDEEFLELIKIKKELYYDYDRYKVYYRNEQIAQFEIKKDANYIWEMDIFEDKYKRKGLATFIHKYIEKDLNIKIVPSKYLTREGKLFYGIKPTRTNPTDKEFLKTIHIKKDYDDLHNTVEYHVFKNEDKSRFDRFGSIPRAFAIASAYYDTKKKWVYDLYVVPKFQRKGLATCLYNYIEQDQKIKLKPSDYLLEPGKAFWKNRLKNPADLSLLRMIKIVRKEIELGVWNRKRKSEEILIVYKIYFRDNQIGYVEIIKGTNFIEDVVINEEFRRKGLANYLYNYIEKDLKIKLRPSSVQYEDGKAFWKARLKK